MAQPDASGTDAAGGAGGFADVWHVLLEQTGPLYVAGPDGYVREANAAFTAHIAPLYPEYGAALPREVVRRTRRHGRVFRRLETVRTESGPRLFEGRHWRPEGHACILGVFQEVTRAEDALAKVRALRAQAEEVLSIVSDWVWRVDADWVFRESSARDRDRLGFDAATVIGHDFFAVGEVADDPRTGRHNAVQRDRRAPFRDVLYRVPGDRGEARLFEVTAIPVFDEHTGAFDGFRGSARDVTREIGAVHQARTYRRELEDTLADLRAKNAELDDALARARAADQAKNAFLAMVGHELRTPLNAVIGFAEMMENETLGPIGNEHYRAYVGDITASARHLLGVINDILDVVKLEMDDIRLHLDEVRVPKAIETCLTFVREKAHKHRIALDTEIQPELKKLVADPQKLRQMVVNLLSNAVKFTPEGGHITVEAHHGEDGGHVIAVRDTGPGIPAEQMDTILAPFKQGDDSLARSHEGLGLGLPLTKRLVEAHGGALHIASTPGEGTRIALAFPPNVAEVAQTGER